MPWELCGVFVTAHDFICFKGITEPFISVSEIQNSWFNFGSSLQSQKSHKSSRFAVTLLMRCSFPILLCTARCNTDQNAFLPKILRYSLPYTEIHIRQRWSNGISSHKLLSKRYGGVCYFPGLFLSISPSVSWPARFSSKWTGKSFALQRMGQRAPGRAAPGSCNAVVLLSSPQTVTHLGSLISLHGRCSRSSRLSSLLREQQRVFLHPLKAI